MTTAIRRVEAGGLVTESTLVAIRSALEWAGAEFTVDDEGKPGVRLRDPVPDPITPTEADEVR